MPEETMIPTLQKEKEEQAKKKTREKLPRWNKKEIRLLIQTCKEQPGHTDNYYASRYDNQSMKQNFSQRTGTAIIQKLHKLRAQGKIPQRKQYRRQEVYKELSPLPLKLDVSQIADTIKAVSDLFYEPVVEAAVTITIHGTVRRKDNADS